MADDANGRSRTLANKIKDKVAIVTGAGQGNGRGIGVAFAKEGAKVVVAEIKPDTGEAVAEELRHLGTDAIAIVCDVSDKQQVQRVVDETIGAFGRVDILVNNAQAWSGYSTTHLGALAEALPKEWWDLSFDTGRQGDVVFLQGGLSEHEGSRRQDHQFHHPQGSS